MIKKKPTKRELETQEKKKRIFDSSLRLFQRYGFDKTTISDISREAGFSNGSIYHFFNNKQSILIQLAQDIYDEGSKYLELTDENLNNPKDAIMKYYTMLTKLHDRYSVDIIRNTAEACSEEYRLGNGRKYMDFSLYLLKDFMKAAQDKGTIRLEADTEKVAEMLHVLYMGSIFTWIYFPISTTIEEVMKRNFDFIFNDIIPKIEK